MHLFFPKGFHQILSASMLAAEQGQMPELHGTTHYSLSKAQKAMSLEKTKI